LLRLGYHPATYLGQDVTIDAAIADISATGWDGFEWSSVRLGDHYDSRTEFKDYLDSLHLSVSGIYCPCGFVTDDDIRRWQEHVDATIDFARAIGTEFMLLDGGSTKLPRTPASVDKIAALANEAGRRISDAGLVGTWHQHWGTLFEYQAEFDALMAATDPALVGFTPDTAQLALGDFDVAATIERYLDRTSYVHFKDLDGDRRFIELGSGHVDFPPLAKMLTDAGFDGWIVVDLDYTSLPPPESSRVNLGYLHSELGLSGRRAPAL